MSKKETEHDTLGNRQKSYEELSTSRQLMPNCPIYARIDGRAFHTFCNGLQKPYSKAFIEAMQETCKYLVKETTAVLGYVQSDEISLGWTDTQHCPFDGRVQKLESVLASMASAKFVHYIMSHTIENTMDLFNRVERYIPSFDCRVFNVPNMTELANAFLWRENDAIRNSILGMAYHMFSEQEVFKKNTDELVHMMRMKGYCFYEDTDPAFMRGTFYHRENYLKELTDEEVARIPEKQRENLEYSKDGYTLCLPNNRDVIVEPNTYYCWRSRIGTMNLPYRLTETADLEKVLFHGNVPECKIENPTFDLSKRGVNMNILYIYEEVKKWTKERYRPTCWIWQDYFAEKCGYENFVEQVEKDVRDGNITKDMSDDEIIQYIEDTLQSNHADGAMLVSHVHSMLDRDFD